MNGDIKEQHVAAFLSGDTDAFDEAAATAFTNYAIKIIRFRYHKSEVRDDDLENLAQDAIVEAWSSRTGFRGDSAFTTWFARIVLRTVYKHHKATRVDRTLTGSLDGIEDDDDGWQDLPVAANADTAETVRLRLLWEEGKTILSGRQLKAFQMERQGYTDQEIGVALGHTSNAAEVAKQLIKRARAKLRNVFSIATGSATGTNSKIMEDYDE